MVGFLKIDVHYFFMSKIRAFFRSIQFMFAAMLGGVASYFLGKFYDTNELAYFATMVFYIIVFGIIIGILHCIIPEEYQ